MPSFLKKTVSIPEQTAPGKETSNPLIVDSLLKTVTEVQTSRGVVSSPEMEI